jgi:hypothetical protein
MALLLWELSCELQAKNPETNLAEAEHGTPWPKFVENLRTSDGEKTKSPSFPPQVTTEFSFLSMPAFLCLWSQS